MKTPSALVGLLALVSLFLTGCVVAQYDTYVPAPPPPARVYLVLVVPEGVAPPSLALRRAEVIDYLLTTGLLAAPEYLVHDPAAADRVVRATLAEVGFQLQVFDQADLQGYSGDLIYLPPDYAYYDTLIFYGAFVGGHYHRDRDRGPRRPELPTPPPHDRPHREPRRDGPAPRPVPGHRPENLPGAPEDRRPARTPEPVKEHPPVPPATVPAHNEHQRPGPDRTAAPDRPKPADAHPATPRDHHPRDDQPRKETDRPTPRATPTAAPRPERAPERTPAPSRPHAEEPARREAPAPAARHESPPPAPREQPAAKEDRSKRDDDKKQEQR